MKRPAFQFYPADWRTDPALELCSLAARGLWISMLCIAHEATPYGYLSVNNRQISTAQLARMVGESPTIVAKLLRELESAGVFSRTEDGVIYSRRMVKDEAVRNARANGGAAGGSHGGKGGQHGAKGGRPRKPKDGSDSPENTYPQATEKPPLHGAEGGFSEPPSKPPFDAKEGGGQKPPPSSSSSSSSPSSIPLSVTHTVNDPPARAPDPPPAPVGAVCAGPSMAGAVCVALRAAGLARTNPAHPQLLALLDQGAGVDSFVAAWRDVQADGKHPADPFAYVLGIVRGQLAQAQQIAASAVATPLRHVPRAESFRERDERLARERIAALTGRQPQPIDTVIDVETTIKRIA